MKEKKNQVIILDFGSQYTQLIARKVREQGVFCKILPHSTTAEELAQTGAGGVVISGGPASVYDQNAPQLDPAILNTGIPILGICYGMQLTAHLLDGHVRRIDGSAEYGKSSISILDKEDPLFHGLNEVEEVWMSHGDSVEQLPSGYQKIACSSSATAAAANQKKKIYLVQFHPEVKHTKNGEKILSNFLFKIANLTADWDMGSFIEESIKTIREQTAGKEVVCGISGGVDSSVLAVLLHKAVGDRLRCIFVDNGLLRKGERENIERRFRAYFDMKVETVDASVQFLEALKGISNPEQKRKIIGDVFLDVFFERAGEFDFLAQGTLYPDVIESGGSKDGPASTIKTHHNRVDKIMQLIEQGRVLEPFQELFKDEVRVIGKKLGMPDEILLRQPFPGPGLAIRIIGPVDNEKLTILKEADSIVVSEMKEANQYYSTWQSFAVLLPVQSVGVMGDERTYENVVAVRSVESSDGMTSSWSHLPYELLEKISTRIINQVDGINRVVYDISSKPPATIEWE